MKLDGTRLTGEGGRDGGLTDGRGSQWRGGRRLAGGDWRVRKRVEVARASQRLTIGWGGRGAGRAADVRNGPAAGVTPKVEEASRGTAQPRPLRARRDGRTARP